MTPMRGNQVEQNIDIKIGFLLFLLYRDTSHNPQCDVCDYEGPYMTGGELLCRDLT